MANGSLIVETALLLLVAFLAGCTLGWLARKLTRRRPASAAIEAPAPAAEAAVTTSPVAVPNASPLFQRPGPTPAQRQAAATGRSPVQPAPPEIRTVAPPAATPTPTLPPPPPRPARLPARLPGEVSMPRFNPAPPEAVPVVAAPAEDPEAAARLAVEGGWTPPPRRSPVPFPEAPAAPEPASAAPAAEAPEVADAAAAAMASARSAVAAAQAAAASALAEAPAGAPPPEQLDHPAPPEQAEQQDRPEQPEQSPPAGVRRRFGAPAVLAEPRAGGKDDLTAIRGITPALADALGRLGIFHYDQVAGWDGKAVVWVDGHLGLRGRIAREKWPEQARRLAARARPLRARR